ncbi:hypothetical protein LUZ60_012650 [Juncus effusus]|nr:hypothetical protein LUZ60_012650 [Juncus effusus]
MLAVPPMPCTNEEARQAEVVPESSGGFLEDFDFTIDAGLLDIDFSDIFQNFDEHGSETLPDLEVDPGEIYARFSAFGEEEEQTVPVLELNDKGVESCDYKGEKSGALMEIIGQAEDAKSSSSSSVEGESKKKAGTVKSSHGKKKAKVDWTPELHRRFVQAVEQLGVDKAVPSRILELMGVDSLTRHNIASHLQKYRSHRKHLQAREAEAASWTQRRQIYATPGSCGIKRETNSSWFVPTIGFPPPPPPPPTMQHFRPFHVWGHPSVESPMVPMWPPQHLGAPRTPSPMWASHPPIPPSGNPSFWHHPYARPQPQPHALMPGSPCVAVPMPTTRFPSSAVPGIVPHPMYRPVVPPPTTSSKNTTSQVVSDAHPSNESIDAAIGDVLEKPWLPLPLGLKPPSTESVMVELQRKGVSKVPPTSTSSS